MSALHSLLFRDPEFVFYDQLKQTMNAYRYGFRELVFSAQRGFQAPRTSAAHSCDVIIILKLCCKRDQIHK